ncbi:MULTISPECIES: alpha/beta fold hydrolase [Streptomyces]|uniref:3-oxoadipate enol-lactonase 2 n=1 Tax=Streptomyces rimosus subsp. rimosus TaxID=132474 RepID=A0ABY3ZAK4_STRRM|nr:hydrolase [Streptomyces rimosus]KEF20231.1 hydrolase [Streptomyces rimosus]UNZ06477.1 3-oxoadipate enol-lactonase 2 [Streptomyces rimosus subsp. rimosus]UTH97933.1 3-oxoadipate enol-lactonase 2 [Streptomyces rimosus subsp. rimosus]UTJ16031.1 3-oxoadipate enol-lactonase 2 [Streptomyces rimosus subsp. rimosus]
MLHTAAVNGITLTYEDTGEADGATVLLVHGHPFDHTMWAPQTTALAAAGHRVIVPDLRGYGASQVVPGTTRLEVFAADLAALLDHLGVTERIVLGGLSMGGQIVMECARRFPHRLRALVLADTFAHAETPEGRRARNAMADRLLREGMGGYTEEVLDKMIAPRTIAARPAVAEHVRRMMRGTPPEGAAAALRGRAERPDYTTTLARLAVPALVAVGRDDTYTPVADAEFLRDRIPDARLTVIEDAAHLPNLEQPDAFDAALTGFLSVLPERVG